MSGYRRFVAYVYEYRKGKKDSNCGYVKVEVRDARCRMDVHLQCEGLAPEMECRVYGFLRKEGLMNGILLGSCRTQENMISCVLETDVRNMGGAGIPLDRMGGMIFVTEMGSFFGTEWDDQPIRPENFREMETEDVKRKQRTPENVKAEMPEVSIPNQEESKTQEPVRNQEEARKEKLELSQGISETEKLKLDARTFETENPKSSQKELETETSELNQRAPESEKAESEIPESSQKQRSTKQENPEPEQSQRIKIQENPEPAQNQSMTEQEEPETMQHIPEPENHPTATLHKDLKKTNLTATAVDPQEDPLQEDPMLQPQKSPSPSQISGEDFSPFEDEDFLWCRRIRPEDITCISGKNCALRQNRFVLYGYYNYGHLLLCKRADGKYLFGVPGGYDQQERFMANMFGFPYFKKSSAVRLPKEKGGYWYRLIDAPNFH